MDRECVVCGAAYEAKRSTSRYCSTRCRTRASRARAAGQVVEMPSKGERPERPAGGLVERTSATLEAVGRLDSWLGQQAVELARRIEGPSADTGSSIAALSRELRSVMEDALDGVGEAEDPIDELRERRDHKRAAAR